MPQKYIASLVLIISMTMPLSVYAQTISPEEVNAGTTDQKPVLFAKPGGNLMKPVFEDRRTASREAVREELKTLIEQKRTMAEQQRMFLKSRLSTFRDARKRDLILTIDSKISSISARRTAQMADALNMLQTILNKIKTKTAALSGCDTAQISTAIADADKAMASASAAVSAQALKTYTVSVQDETTAKASVGATVKLLNQDLQATHKAVMDAKHAVKIAAMTYSKTKHLCVKVSGTPGEESSGEAEVTNTPTTGAEE